MIAILKRELKAYFNTVTGWLYIAVIIAFVGTYFTAFNLSQGYPYFSYTLNSVSFVFLIITPILTMRIIAEERKQKTDQLLLTSPVSVKNIVLGKYLAMIIVFLFPTVLFSFYPLILRTFGKVPMAESYTAVLGFFLFGAANIAIGLFVSSVTESQVIAAVLTFVFLFLGFMMKGLTGLISQSGNVVTKILSGFDLASSFRNLSDGVFDVSAIVYLVTIIGFFLFLTCQSIQKRRWS